MRLKIKLLLVASFLLLFTNLYAQQKKMPNVIFIMADDLGIGDLGTYGQRFIKTPAIDQLAKEGVRFAQHYAGNAVCGPSRASLITGKHNGHANVRGNALTSITDGEQFDLPLAGEEITIAEIMKQKNYATACIGKWGMGGPNSEGSPNKQGFDYFFGFLNQASAHKYYPAFLFENDIKIPFNKKVYSEDIFDEKALEFIDKNAKKPFFLYFVPTLPHAELKVPNDDVGEYDGLFTEKPFIGDPTGVGFSPQAKPLATYAAMVARLDKSVQKIRTLLKERNIDHNTLIVFTSDNGVHDRSGYNPYVMDSNGPFRGIKRDMYEGGVRTPYIVHWPEQIAPNTTTFHVAAFYDFLPTLCDLVGVKIPLNCDGISFLPSLTGLGIQKKHDFLYWEIHENGGLQAVLKNNWKLIRFNVDKKVYRYELYNLNADPGEALNVVAQYPNTVKNLSLLMDKSHVKNDRYPFDYEIKK